MSARALAKRSLKLAVITAQLILGPSCADDAPSGSNGASGSGSGSGEPNACGLADQKLSSCGMMLPPTEDCSGPYRCLADCINNASCDEIADPDNSPDYGECLQDAQACS